MRIHRTIGAANGFAAALFSTGAPVVHADSTPPGQSVPRWRRAVRHRIRPVISALCVCTALVGAPGRSAATMAPAEPTCSMVSFRSGQTDVPAERCDPSGEAPASGWPAALVLDGCGFHGSGFTPPAGRALATAGIVSIDVDYHAAAPAPPGTYCTVPPTNPEGLATILTAVADAVAWLRTDPSIDPDAIGAVGYSLGGLLAIYAHTGDSGIGQVEPVEFAAIVAFAAPIFDDVVAAAEAGDLPPLYVVHGERDDIVPVEASLDLQAAAITGGTAVTVVAVPGVDHGWGDPTTDQVRPAILGDAAGFLTRELAR
jgi:dienelactone hydrolase